MLAYADIPCYCALSTPFVGSELNTAEGARRLSTIIRWIGDGNGILCCFGGMANLFFGTTPFDDRVAVAAFGLFFAAFF